MTSVAKARIDVNSGIIELEGSEEFVTKYLDEFKTQIKTQSNPSGRLRQAGDSGKKETKTVQREKDAGERKKSGPRKIDVEEFEVKGDSKTQVPSLKAFLEEKKAMEKSPKTILAIGYYITHIRSKEEFSEGNIEFAYKALQLTGRPANLHQVLINRKNKERWYEQGSDSTHWKLGRLGQLYVEESMPDKTE